MAISYPVHAQTVTVSAGQTVGPQLNVARVNNAGTIDGGNATAITTVGTDPISGGAFIENSGTIRSSSTTSTIDVIGGTINSISNSGTIRNDGSGTAIGGSGQSSPLGSISLNNLQGATVTAAGGTAIAAERVLVINAGTINGNTVGGSRDNSVTLYNIDTLVGGTLNGNILFAGGEDRVALATGSVVNGTIDGGAGIDTILLNGTSTGSGSFGGATNFELLEVRGGNWTLTNSQLYSGGISIASGARAIATAATLSGNTIANAGTLQFDQANNGSFTGAITGSGAVTKTGAGTLTLGAQTFTGSANVTQGTLALTGNLATGLYTVSSGATLTSALSATISTTAATVDVTNNGTISTSNGTGRAINLAGSNNSRNITITNNAGGVIQSADDAVRVNFNPTGGTITVNNAGIIRTTNGGQAIDFDAAASGSATIVINNFATGELRSFGQDGIRPGQGATVNNAGLIYADGPINNNYDGIDWQNKAGVVNNLSTGTISGLRHGITSDVNVNVTNAGTIIGRNGSGVGSDGTGTVVNTGTITGQWDGLSTNGDGDGVDIDGIGTVVNSGTIQGLTATGVDSGLRPNSAQGVAMGGGSITNSAGGTIFGGAQGVLINLDTNTGGAAVGATTIVNAGTIRGGTAEAIQFVGTFNDSITTSGAIIGGNGVAIDMGGGDDTLTILNGATFTGRIDGGAGTDTIILGGTGGIFGNAVNFETVQVTGTGWSLSQPLAFANGLSIAAGGSLTGNSFTLAGPVLNNGTLIVDQAQDGTFGGTLSGTGALVKTGAGSITLGTQSGFRGAITVAAGRLGLNGTLLSQVLVQTGATLGGNGAVGATSIAAGGIIAPGNSIGTLTINGAFSAASGSSYLAETTAAGLSDLIAVNGTATLASGARLVVSRDTGTYVLGRRYVVLTATGGVTGSYTLVQSSDPLTEFRLGSTGTTVYVDVARSGAAVVLAARTRNQLAVAPAFAALGSTNAAYAALTLEASDEAVRAGLDNLSGEVHSTVLTTLLKDTQALQAATRSRLLGAGDGAGVWAQALYRTGTDHGNSAIGLARSNSEGAVGGVDVALNDWGRVGIAGGYTRTKLYIDSRSSDARLENTHLLGYAGAQWGAVRVNLTVGYAWSDITTRRTVAFTGFSERLTSAYDGKTLHGSADIGYRLPFGGGSVEPFAAIEAYSVKRDGFVEAGGSAALASGERQESYTISTLGARIETPVTATLGAQGHLGWRHAFGEVYPSSLMRFASGTTPFRVYGAPLTEDAASASIELKWTPRGNVAITGGYSGIIGDATDDSRFLVGIAVGF